MNQGDFVVAEMSKLPFRERAKRYYAQAWDARLKAAKSTGELQAAYIALAAQWEQLAKEADEHANKESEPD
jgi:hypothetical protein